MIRAIISDILHTYLSQSLAVFFNGFSVLKNDYLWAKCLAVNSATD